MHARRGERWHGVASESANSRARRYGREESEFDRALAFFDAVYALALTLLVTTLDVGADPSEWADLSALWDAVGSQFIAFVISFVVIGAYWLRNHRLLSSFSAIDTHLIVLNLALAGVIILLPFTTESLGEEPASDLPLPTAVYAVNIACASILSTVVYVVARRRGLLRAADDSATARATVAGALAPAAVFLVSVPIAYVVSTGAAQWSWFALVVLAVVERAAHRHKAAA